MTAYKDEKRGTWYSAFRYTDFTGARKHTCKRGFKTKKEALQYERDFLGRQSHRADIPFKELVANYMEYKEQRLKPTTFVGKETVINKHILPYFGKRKTSEIDIKDIHEWQETIMSLRKENGEPFSKTYLKTINAQLSAIFNYAVLVYGLPGNPCTLAGSMGSSKADEMHFYTKEQFERFISYEDVPILHLGLNTLYWTGLRIGELLALTPADIFPDHVVVNKNFAKVKGVSMILETKTPRSKRIVSYPKRIYDEFQDYFHSIYGIGDDERIFPYTKQAFEKEMKRLADLAGLEQIRVHDLRHSHAALLARIGVPITEVSRRMGHESISTTWDIYGHLYPGADQDLAEKLDSIWDSNVDFQKIADVPQKRLDEEADDQPPKDA